MNVVSMTVSPARSSEVHPSTWGRRHARVPSGSDGGNTLARYREFSGRALDACRQAGYAPRATTTVDDWTTLTLAADHSR